MPELVAASARLLRAEQVASAEANLFQAVILTFDVARLTIAPSPDGEEIALRLDAGASPTRGSAVPADDEEPWWRVLGNPLHGAWARSDLARAQVALELQFRADHANPRVIAVELADRALRVLLRQRLVG
jgi:hypothetical protein